MPTALNTTFSNRLHTLRHNERRVLQVLRRMGHASKAEIARTANLTNAAIGTIVKSLEKEKLIISGKKNKKGQRGQPATMLHLNPTGAYGVGVRIDRNSIQTVLIDFDGSILSQINHEMILPEPEETLRLVTQDVQTVLNNLPKHGLSRLTGIGLAKPYNLGSWLKELGLPANSFKKWDNFDFAAKLERKTGITIHEENDGTAATIAELFYGTGREIDNFLYLFFGPAIGGGIVINGDIVRGHTGNAADVGVMPVVPSSLASTVKPEKNWDILLNRASLNSLRRHLQNKFSTRKFDTKSSLEQAVQTETATVKEWIVDCVDAIAPTIMAGKALLDYQALVISANLDGNLIELIHNQLEITIKDHIPETGFPPVIINATFGSNAGAVGAASIPVFYNFSPRKPITQSQRI